MSREIAPAGHLPDVHRFVFHRVDNPEDVDLSRRWRRHSVRNRHFGFVGARIDRRHRDRLFEAKQTAARDQCQKNHDERGFGYD